MESSEEEEEEFPNIESIIPQSKVDSLYQSSTEKGIRKLCCELLDLKDAVENLCGNMQTKYLAFLRISEEAKETKHELVELRKHISSQGILVQDLMVGVSRELEDWKQSNCDSLEAKEDLENLELNPTSNEIDEHQKFLEKIDVLLAERRVEEALEALETEEKNSAELKSFDDASLAEKSSYKTAFFGRKVMLETQLVEIAEQPSISVREVKKTLNCLIRLGKGPLAHQLLLKFYGSRVQKSISALLPSCSICPRTYPATLSKIVFTIISLTIKESASVFGDDPVYTNRIVQWAEWEIEYFVRLIKENAPSSETVSALRAASVCVQSSLNYCLALEKQGLKLSKLVLVLLRPFIEEVLELNFRRARKFVLGLVELDKNVAPRYAAPLSTFAPSSDSLVIDSGIRFMCVVEDLLEQLTPLISLHFGGNILNRIGQLFDKFMDALIKALPGPTDDDGLTELKEGVPFRAETDSEQLSILGMAFTILDELLPNSVLNVWQHQNGPYDSKAGPTEGSKTSLSNTSELKEWKRHLQHSFDKLRDHFCRQYVLCFIYSREGKTRLNAQIYLSGDGEDLHWDSDPLPSLPFQALFAKLQQLATVAGDVLLGKEKIQKILLARLTETVVMWLSDEQDFWNIFENGSGSLQPLGLQQLILDMHFTVEIARFAGYPSRHVHQIASAITARAIRAFSARGIDPNSALPEDEWFVETAKSAINKLLMGAEGSENSEVDEDEIMHDDIISDSEDTVSSLSTEESFQSFASATMGELDSPPESTDAES